MCKRIRRAVASGVRIKTLLGLQNSALNKYGPGTDSSFHDLSSYLWYVIPYLRIGVTVPAFLKTLKKIKNNDIAKISEHTMMGTADRKNGWFFYYKSYMLRQQLDMNLKRPRVEFKIRE